MVATAPNRNEILRKFYETNQEYQLVEKEVIQTRRRHDLSRSYLIVVYGESLPLFSIIHEKAPESELFLVSLADNRRDRLISVFASKHQKCHNDRP